MRSSCRAPATGYSSRTPRPSTPRCCDSSAASERAACPTAAGPPQARARARKLTSAGSTVAAFSRCGQCPAPSTISARLGSGSSAAVRVKSSAVDEVVASRPRSAREPRHGRPPETARAAGRGSSRARPRASRGVDSARFARSRDSSRSGPDQLGAQRLYSVVEIGEVIAPLRRAAPPGSLNARKCRPAQSDAGVRANRLGCGIPSVTIARTRSGSSAAAT